MFQPLLYTINLAVARFKCWLRFITDPELPDDDEKLFFTIINLDMASLSEVRRLTSLELEGRIDQAGLDAFVKAGISVFMCFFNATAKRSEVRATQTSLSFQGGGVLDPNSQLKIGEMAGTQGVAKLMSAMGDCGKKKTRKTKKVRASRMEMVR